MGGCKNATRTVLGGPRGGREEETFEPASRGRFGGPGLEAGNSSENLDQHMAAKVATTRIAIFSFFGVTKLLSIRAIVRSSGYCYSGG